MMSHLISNRTNNRYQFKSFDAGSIFGIASEINEWLNTEPPTSIEIIDVVYSSIARSSGSVSHGALVYYTKREQLSVIG